MGSLTRFTLKYGEFMGWLTGVVIFGAIIVAFYVAYLLWWPFEPIRYDSVLQDIAVSHMPTGCEKTKDGLFAFSPGDIVPLRTSGVKLMDIPAQIMPRLVDTSVTLLPDYTAKRPLGKFDEVILTHRIPRNMTSGVYYFEFTVVYEVNPIRKITYQTRSVPFYVQPLKSYKEQSCIDCKKGVRIEQKYRREPG